MFSFRIKYLIIDLYLRLSCHLILTHSSFHANNQQFFFYNRFFFLSLLLFIKIDESFCLIFIPFETSSFLLNFWFFHWNKKKKLLLRNFVFAHENILSRLHFSIRFIVSGVSFDDWTVSLVFFVAVVRDWLLSTIFIFRECHLFFQTNIFLFANYVRQIYFVFGIFWSNIMYLFC